MSRIPDDNARWKATICILIFLPTLLISCASTPTSRSYVGPETRIRASGSDRQTFPELWNMWTIRIGESRGSGSGLLIAPFRSGGSGDGRNLFPLQVTATLMDSALIESGLCHFAGLAALTPEEEADFRRKYLERFDPKHHLLIWCDIRTTMAANYLALDRWTIYIEDNDINRCEPDRIFQEQTVYNQTVMARPLAFQSEFGLPSRETHLKRVLLLFPRYDYYGEPLLSDRTKHLKLIFQLNEDETVTGEGRWLFEKQDTSAPPQDMSAGQ